VKNLLFIIGILILLPIKSKAQEQLLDSLALEQADEFTSIDSAMKYPDKVVKLILRKKKLTSVPKEIFSFPNLQYLDMSKNRLKELPAEIGNMPKLQKLVLSRNNIEYLPGEIGNLKNLRDLNISQNDLVALPPQIGNLENLLYLDLWNNNLSKFPEELSKLKKLRMLDLRVILIEDAEQAEIKEFLPDATIYFSPSCKCKQ
jgi:Leucine-rich repeat (LRR) protein